ncbi:MAG: hypothetical protein AAF192_03010 [Pseudomonadota bacterium]
MQAGAALIVLLAGAAPAEAESFTAADFLTWDDANRGAYVEISVGMAGLIAQQIDAAKAECITTWYFSRMSAANDEVYAAMRRFPDHHPRALILAVLRKRCDVFQRED